ncbi:MAG: glucokinase [Chloroflexi bacterium]|nr:glucokinase [Chloroflexota bacterium]
MLLAGDIGGTKTALALYSRASGPRQPLHKAIFPSADYPSLEAIVAAFLAAEAVAGQAPGRACFGVAGPVVDGRSQVTNLTWTVDAGTLSQSLGGAPVQLLNDLEAIGHALPFLEGADLETINPGHPRPRGPLAVIAPGTGLGEAFVVWDGARYRPHATEGGHASFAPENDLEIELLRYMWREHHHVSYERVCSGLGMPNLYAFLRDTGRYPEPDWLREQLAASDDHTPILVQLAASRSAEICVATLDLFLSILGNEAGNLALKVLASGGVYLGGGIPPRILPQLRQGAFMAAFTNKGRFRPMMEQLPVHVIWNSEAGLFGAACYGLEVHDVR